MSLDKELEKGLELLEKGELLKADGIFKSCIEKSPGNYNAWLYHGIVLNELGKHKDALESFKKCTEIDESLPYAWSNMGLVYQKMHDVYEAIRHFFKATRIDPSDLASRLNLGMAYLKVRNKENEAMQEFKVVLENDKDIAEAWYYLGTIYFDLMRKDLALYCFETAKKLGLSTEKARNNKLITDLRFDEIQPKNPFDRDIKDIAFDPAKVRK
ncbi:MAG: tetratricopeptide repeat protein [Promethearchaeota archaeon]